jgi:hypothetical protein
MRRQPLPRPAALSVYSRRTVAVSIGLLVLATAGPAGAKLLTPTSATKVSAGAATVTSCGTLSSASVNYAVRAGTIQSFTISGLPAGCNGGSLTATLNQSGTDVGHGGPVTVSSGIASIAALSANPAASNVTDVRIAILGP